MKTSELLNALSEDQVTPPAPRRALTLALIPAVVIAVCLFLAVLGPRPHFLALLAEPRFLFKLIVCDLLVAFSGLLVLRLFRPGAAVHGALMLAVVPPALLAIGVGVELAVVPAAQWGPRLVGSNSMACLKSIPFLGFAPLIATLFALRNGAPERPALAGAGAGLFAGAIGAALYATHCPDDSPLFVAVWYPLAIALLTGLGAVLGARLLRW
ncbi:conserved membrane hypothetical protein [Methylocella tundrae]|nr:conserved membrane hypothetical protein [Methylocella tundrae]